MNPILRLSTICRDDASALCQAPFVLQARPKRIVAATNGAALLLLHTREPAPYKREYAALALKAMSRTRPESRRIRVDRLVRFCGSRAGHFARPARLGTCVFDRHLLAKALWALGWSDGEADLHMAQCWTPDDSLRIVGTDREIFIMGMRPEAANKRTARLPESVYVRHGKVRT